jgi:hypothetical protein
METIKKSTNLGDSIKNSNKTGYFKSVPFYLLMQLQCKILVNMFLNAWKYKMAVGVDSVSNRNEYQEYSWG